MERKMVETEEKTRVLTDESGGPETEGDTGDSGTEQGNGNEGDGGQGGSEDS